jgi:hypothetical protein
MSDTVAAILVVLSLVCLAVVFAALIEEHNR